MNLVPDLSSYVWSFLSTKELRECDDALRKLLWSGGLDGEESRALVRVHWRLQREMLTRGQAC